MGAIGIGKLGIGGDLSQLKVAVLLDNKTAKDFFQIEKDTKKMESSFKQITKTALGFFGGAIMVSAIKGFSNLIKGATKGIFTLAQAHGDFATIQAQFLAMTKDETSMLIDLQKATAGTVSDFDLMASANKAFLLGVPKELFPELAEGARLYARAMNIDVKSAINDVATGVGRQSQFILDNIGINIKSIDAYRRYAVILGKTTSELTAYEKKTAFANETVRIMNENLGALDVTGTTFQETIGKMQASITNLKIEIGQNFSDVFTIAINGITAFTKNWKTNLESFVGITKNVFGGTLANLFGFDEVKSGFDNLAESFTNFFTGKELSSKTIRVFDPKAEVSNMKELAEYKDKFAQETANYQQKLSDVGFTKDKKRDLNYFRFLEENWAKNPDAFEGIDQSKLQELKELEMRFIELSESAPKEKDWGQWETITEYQEPKLIEDITKMSVKFKEWREGEEGKKFVEDMNTIKKSLITLTTEGLGIAATGLKIIFDVFGWDWEGGADDMTGAIGSLALVLQNMGNVAKTTREEMEKLEKFISKYAKPTSQAEKTEAKSRWSPTGTFGITGGGLAEDFSVITNKIFGGIIDYYENQTGSKLSVATTLGVPATAQFGGAVKHTGYIFAHEGETITPAGGSSGKNINVYNTYNVNSESNARLTARLVSREISRAANSRGVMA